MEPEEHKEIEYKGWTLGVSRWGGDNPHCSLWVYPPSSEGVSPMAITNAADGTPDGFALAERKGRDIVDHWPEPPPWATVA